MPVRLVFAHQVGEAAAAGHDHHLAAAGIGQHLQPVAQDRIAIEAAADLDDRQRHDMSASARSIATATAGAQTPAQPRSGAGTPARSANAT